MNVRDALGGTVYVYNNTLPDVIGSIRLVAFIPARHLGTRALYFGPELKAEEFLDAHQPKVLIFTKAFDASVLELARAALRRDIKIISCFCDLRFSGEVGRLDGDLLRLSNAVVVPNAWMANEVLQRFGKRSAIIEDVFEYPRRTASFAPERPLKVLWFGHSANHDTLIEGIKALLAARLGSIDLVAVTYPQPELDELDALMKQNQFKVTYISWSHLVQHEAFDWCDLVFLPSIDAWEKRMKSHNRLVEAINSGRLAIAYPLPQYQELAEFCLCDEDYGRSIRTAVADPLAMLKRIEAGQRYIDGRFAPEVVARKWRELITSVSNS